MGRANKIIDKFEDTVFFLPKQLSEDYLFLRTKVKEASLKDTKKQIRKYSISVGVGLGLIAGATFGNMLSKDLKNEKQTLIEQHNSFITSREDIKNQANYKVELEKIVEDQNEWNAKNKNKLEKLQRDMDTYNNLITGEYVLGGALLAMGIAGIFVYRSERIAQNKVNELTHIYNNKYAELNKD